MKGFIETFDNINTIYFNMDVTFAKTFCNFRFIDSMPEDVNQRELFLHRIHMQSDNLLQNFEGEFIELRDWFDLFEDLINRGYE